MRLALSFATMFLSSRRGFTQVSPRPRRSVSISNTRPRIGKVVIIKTRRYKRLVLGSFFAPETDIPSFDFKRKALLLLPRPKGSSTSSEEHYANPPELTHEDVLQEH